MTLAEGNNLDWNSPTSSRVHLPWNSYRLLIDILLPRKKSHELAKSSWNPLERGVVIYCAELDFRRFKHGIVLEIVVESNTTS